jgi:hypothetical protein
MLTIQFHIDVHHSVAQISTDPFELCVGVGHIRIDIVEFSFGVDQFLLGNCHFEQGFITFCLNPTQFDSMQGSPSNFEAKSVLVLINSVFTPSILEFVFANSILTASSLVLVSMRSFFVAVKSHRNFR